MEENGRLLNNFSLQILSNSISTKNMLLGNKIRSLRDEQGILQRQVAAYLEFAANNSSSDINNARLSSCIQWEHYGIIYA